MISTASAGRRWARRGAPAAQPASGRARDPCSSPCASPACGGQRALRASAARVRHLHCAKGASRRMLPRSAALCTHLLPLLPHPHHVLCRGRTAPAPSGPAAAMSESGHGRSGEADLAAIVKFETVQESQQQAHVPPGPLQRFRLIAGVVEQAPRQPANLSSELT
jgi:hypothetical protein